ncbi:NRDE family protein [Bacillus sp. FJAT-50079]|uniref:NRDE family protein n=1 Tax=Bacillus sp. FJAT-50079 TaxID=2833577 RepID=UPI001BC92F85|nr:NRDE family protein [Bacillus sp. FJAT-50079]MBS4208681.1 NRDE family protein [Bacillus sp. FJAT-50079]
MCIVFAAYSSHPNYRLIIAANRDEFYGRPTEQAHFWQDEPNVLAGRDLQQMGTWMGITTYGRFAALTNFRDPTEEIGLKQSRGHIVQNFLTGNEKPIEFLQKLQHDRMNYRGFNILLSDYDSFFYYSNVENKITQLKPGLYGLSNHLLNTPWPKVEKGKKFIEEVISKDETINEEELFRLLNDHEHAPIEALPTTGVSLDWEKKLSSIFINTPNYGTRCSTVLTVNSEGFVRFTERTFPISRKQQRHFQFKIK